jgi:hypothetical protein
MMTDEAQGLHQQLFNKDMMAKSLATGVVVSTITQTGRGLVGRLVKSPFAMLAVGIALGYLTHKYRKEIIVMSSNASEQSKDFLLRQKENIKDAFLDTDKALEIDGDTPT